MLKAKCEVNIYYHEEEKGIPRKASFIVFLRHTDSICSGYKNYTKWKSNKNFATMHKMLFPVSRLLEENLFFHSINRYASIVQFTQAVCSRRVPLFWEVRSG